MVVPADRQLIRERGLCFRFRPVTGDAIMGKGRARDRSLVGRGGGGAPMWSALNNREWANPKTKTLYVRFGPGRCDDADRLEIYTCVL